jgi:hypothetical protein
MFQFHAALIGACAALAQILSLHHVAANALGATAQLSLVALKMKTSARYTSLQIILPITAGKSTSVADVLHTGHVHCDVIWDLLGGCLAPTVPPH